MKNRIIIISALVFIGILWSCKKDDLTIKPEFTRKIGFEAPIIKSVKIVAEELIEKLDSASLKFLYIDENNLINFKYDTTFSNEWSDLVEFNELTLDKNYQIITPIKAKADTVFYDSIPINFLEGQRFDSISIATANLELEMRVPDDFIGNYTIGFPGLIKKNGKTVEYTEKDFENSSSTSEDLANSDLYFAHRDSNSYLVIKTVVSVPSIKSPKDFNFGFTFNMTNLKPDRVYGYFGTMDVIDQAQEFNLGFFEGLNLPAEIRFKAMSINIGINNYFGVPLGVRIDSLLFLKQGEEPVEVLIDDIVIESAEIDPNNGDILPVYDSIYISEAIPGLMDGINMAPEKIYIDFAGMVNPLGNPDGNVYNFVAADNILDGIAKIQVPLWFNTSEYERFDTLSLDIDTAQLKYFDEIKLTFNFENSFPFNISANAFMSNVKNGVDSTIFSDDINLIQSPNIEADGTSKSAIKTVVPIVINSDRLLKIKQAGGDKVVLKTWVQIGDQNTNPETFVKLLTTNYLNIGLNVEGKSGAIN